MIRALEVLRLLAGQAGPVPAAVIARELGMPRSTAYRLLTDMAVQGFVTHLPEERLWGLDVGAFEIGSAYLRHRPLERLARPLLQSLVDDIDETAHLGVLTGPDVMYLLKERPRRPVPLISEVGVRLPASLTASGRALLAHLPRAQVRALFPSAAVFVDRTGRGPRSPEELRRALAADRRQGWSEEDEHIADGLASLAVGAFDHGGRPAAAIGVTFRREAYPAERRAALAHRIGAAAAALSRRLHGTARPPAEP
jgi:DNA-binding IclR family transcriptional regulator